MKLIGSKKKLDCCCSVFLHS